MDCNAADADLANSNWKPAPSLNRNWISRKAVVLLHATTMKEDFISATSRHQLVAIKISGEHQSKRLGGHICHLTSILKQ